jgi:EAL domain-containing protein (putative c-di-GMP-specific phosphodiesterase class I)
MTLDALPYTIGRDVTCPLRLNTKKVSRLHAQIHEIEGQFYVTDLHSTNGTFINHERIMQPTPLYYGDVIHIGDHEFRLLESTSQDESTSDVVATMIGLSPLSSRFPTQGKEFVELLVKEMVHSYAQVIINRQGECCGYELLGRGLHPALEEGPLTLFTLAHAFDQEIALSELFRRQSLADAYAMGVRTPLFFNTHPKECQEVDRLLRELASLRDLYPDLALVCEIHESAVTDPRRMAALRSGLQAFNIGLAYDDFGSGQARLLEFVEVPPDVLKFDYALISALTGPEAPTFRLVETLTALAREMGIKTLAEGVETEVVAQTCMALGIDYFQGYFYGKPAPLCPHGSTRCHRPDASDTRSPVCTDQEVPF